MLAPPLAARARYARVALVGVFLMGGSWLADACLDARAGSRAFLDAVLHPTRHELAMRSLFLGTLLIFLLYIAKILREHQRQGELLEAALLSAETEKARSDAVLEAVGDAISIQDADYRILYQNAAHKRLLGHHEGELCYVAYQQDSSPCPGCHMARSMSDGTSHRTELRRKTLKGPAYLELISTPLRDGTGRIVAGIEAVRDMTERKQAEIEIKRMNKELEQHARELAAVNRDLEAFSYSLSHDLRTYITRISTAEQILGELCKGPEAQYLVQSIGESCRGMDELIEAMLTLSQVAHKEMEWGEVDLSALALEAVLHLQQQDQRHARVEITPGLTARGDRHLLKIALENLMANAWKYSAQAREPQILFGVREEGGRRLYFVRDNGVGFSMSEASLLFKPFSRLQSSRGYQGNGVGLATVQRAIQRHGGEVWGEGEPGQGAAFYFSLPG